jgi:hypothetical protein
MRKTSNKRSSDTTRQSIIPQGYGLGLPIGRNNADDFSPLGLSIGTFTPLGATGEFFELYAKPFVQSKIIANKTDNNYMPLTVPLVSNALENIAYLIEQVHFIAELQRLSNNIDNHFNKVTAAFLNDAVTGKLMVLHRRAIEVLNGIPFPQTIYDAYVRGFEWTLVSDSPYAPIRGTIPRGVFPGFDHTISAYTLGKRIQSTIAAITVDAGTLNAMQNMFGGLKLKLPDSRTKFTINRASLQNNMNLPWTGTMDPNLTPDAIQPLYYRSTVEEDGLFTFSYVDVDQNPDLPAGSIWNVTTDALFGLDPICHVDDTGKLQSSTNSADDIANFGMCRSGSGAIDNVSPYDVTNVKATASGIFAGIADKLLR